MLEIYRKKVNKFRKISNSNDWRIIKGKLHVRMHNKQIFDLKISVSFRRQKIKRMNLKDQVKIS